MNEKIYYIYGHTRLDKNVMFYIGKSTKNLNFGTFKKIHKRAFSKAKRARNNFWFKVINKTQYRVEILFESASEEEVFAKERELIKLYGRVDLGTGTLVNFTDGGEGLSNLVRKVQYKRGKDNKVSKPVYAYFKNGVFYKKFDCHSDAAKELKLSRPDIRKVLIGQTQYCMGFVFKNEYQGEKIKVEIKPSGRLRKINCYDLNMNFVQSFPSVTEAARFVGADPTNICKACKSIKAVCRGYKFQYDDASGPHLEFNS